MPRNIQLIQYQPEVSFSHLPEEPGSDVLVPVVRLHLIGPEGVIYEYTMSEELRDTLVSKLQGKPQVDVVRNVPQFLGQR